MSIVSFLAHHRFPVCLNLFGFLFCCKSMHCSGCSALNGVNPNFFLKKYYLQVFYTIQSLLYGCCRIIQIAAGKINKNAKDLYLVKAPKNSKTKKKVFVKTKAINFKMYYIRNPVDTKKWTSNPSINLKFLRRRQNLVKKAWVPKDLIN